LYSVVSNKCNAKIADIGDYNAFGADSAIHLPTSATAVFRYIHSADCGVSRHLCCCIDSGSTGEALVVYVRTKVSWGGYGFILKLQLTQ
jgi:hypothetical protein